MAFLTPDKTRIEHGLIIRERIVPDSARATRYVASYVPQGGKMKPCVKLSNGTGRVGGVTIHNTADIDEAPATNDAEQYSRAYWPNCAMGGVAVQYYVDEVEAWQNLRDNEQGWHAADGNGPGNTTTIAIEIIMDGSGNAADIGAEKNGALLAALLLKKYGLGIDELYTHNHWMGLPDKIVYGKPKNCPIYILPHWDKFVAKVKGYLTELSGGGTVEPPAPELPTDIEPGSRVTIGKDALYGGLNDSRGKPVPPDQFAPKAHTVNKIGIHNHQSEALLQEIFSWVPTKHLAPVQTAVTPPQEDTSEYTMICGRAVATPAQMRAYLHKKNPAAPDYAELYFREGATEGVRGDIAFAQSCVETGYWKFGGDVKREQNNFCGMGATGGGVAGASFDTPQVGIRAQVQHLKGYASAEPLAGACVDPRFNYLTDRRACAPYAEWLGIPENPKGMGWAAGKGYGASILAILSEIMETDIPSDNGTVSQKEYDELQQKYEDIWKRYDAKTLALKEIAGELQQCVDKIKKLTSDM